MTITVGALHTPIKQQELSQKLACPLPQNEINVPNLKVSGEVRTSKVTSVSEISLLILLFSKQPATYSRNDAIVLVFTVFINAII